MSFRCLRCGGELTGDRIYNQVKKRFEGQVHCVKCGEYWEPEAYLKELRARESGKDRTEGGIDEMLRRLPHI